LFRVVQIEFLVFGALALAGTPASWACHEQRQRR
jgi:hypothetical protein